MQTIKPPPSSLALAAIAREAATVLARDPRRAESLAQSLLKIAPADPRGLLIVGSARRRQGDLSGADAVLAPLAKAYPRAANTQYEYGATLAALGRRSSAIGALRQAVRLNRDLSEAWGALGDALFADGDTAGADSAYAEQNRAAVRDPALRAAAEAEFRGDLTAAETLLQHHLERHPDHAEALGMLARTAARQGRFGDAEILLARVLKLDPELEAARFAYASALFRQQKAAEALSQTQILLRTAPASPAYLNLLAACLGLVGDHDGAIGIYERLLVDFDKQPGLWLNHGHVLRTVGRQEEAVLAYRRCIALNPGHGEAYWSLANLKVAAFSKDDVATMQALAERQDLPNHDRLHLHYALGKALEDQTSFQASFCHYAEGARLRRAEGVYDAAETRRLTERSKALFSRQFFAEREPSDAASPTPIFIVGLPRSGSTLIEQILSSHPLVEGTMELPDITFIAKMLGYDAANLSARPYPQAVADLTASDRAQLGRRYLSTTTIQRKLNRKFFIDKMPNNFQHLGLILTILPTAKIIDARRHPMATGFSVFKQHFAQGQSFSYDLSDIGYYYRDYVDLMEAISAAAPGKVHRIIYEDLVEDTEIEVRKLLHYCELPFNQACMKFYENKRAVRTVSSEQVRRPIFRSGLDQWRNYEPWLGPLKTALGSTLETWRP